MQAQKLIKFMENQIQDFENQKALQQNKNRNLGIIYTPNEIVDYIVSNIFRIFFREYFTSLKINQVDVNIEKLVDILGRNPEFKVKIYNIIKNLRILDPSCGSGRFLISIAEKLYKIYQVVNPGLSPLELKKSIIERNLYANEIDQSAIVIAKLRLIQWLLSNDPNNITYYIPNFKSFKATNINHFIEILNLKFNIYNLDFLLEFDSDKFDIIVGNPPYVENKRIKDKEFKKKLINRYQSAYRLFDLSIIFIERSLELLNIGGYLSLILPNKFLSADYGIKIRSLLLNESEIKEIINISSLSVFQNAATYPIILSSKKTNQIKKKEIVIKSYKKISELVNNAKNMTLYLNQSQIDYLPSKVIPLSDNINLLTFLFKNFEAFDETFKDLKIIYRPFGFLKYGRHYDNISNKPQSDNDLLLIGTSNVGKFHIKFDKRIKIMGNDLEISYFNYNSNFEHIWNDLNSEKLIFREIAKDLTFFYDPGVFTNITGLYFIKIPSLNTDQLFGLLTILNSEFMNSVFKSLFSTLHMAGGYLRFNGSFIKRLPMPRIFPMFLSQLGKILQFLSQLNYSFNSSNFKYARNNELEQFKDKYNNKINVSLTFFNKLSNSLVKLLFLDEFYLKNNIDYNILRDLLDLRGDFQKIPAKFLIPVFHLKNYKVFSFNELDCILTEIVKFCRRLQCNKELLKQVDNLLKTNFS
ncbi:MAG: Eco57I restriction-modification methylase domain-containing protein [Promethearchaeota archaeon]